MRELLVQVWDAREVRGRKDLPDGPPGTLIQTDYYYCAI